MIVKGNITNSRHGRNYIQDQANARLAEAVAPTQGQQNNALGVDFFEVDYYQISPTSLVCSCRQTEVVRQEFGSNLGVDPTLVRRGVDSEVSIEWNRPLFGQVGETSSDQRQLNEADEMIDDFEVADTDVVGTTDSVVGSGQDCGICYRTGFVPGYQAYGKIRNVFTTYHIEDVSGYSINKEFAPNSLTRNDEEGYVEYLLNVPKYFKSVKCSVRNNKEVLTDGIWSLMYTPISINHLRASAGHSLSFRVVADEFTHVVIEFDLGTQPIHANIAQMSKTTDWTMFETLGNLNVVLPVSIGKVTSGDLIFVPSRKIGLKITDVQYMQTSKDAKIDWSCNTRVLQPQEAMCRLPNGLNIL